ncbi:MAG: transglutaminase-like cysteine peptidase [Cucumibacter sp.]
MNKFGKFLVALILASGLLSQAALAAQRSSAGGSVSRISTGQSTAAPVGFLIFCVKYPSYCRGGGASQVVMTDQLMTLLSSVNRTVNRLIRARNERRDTWEINVRVGDCEDFVLAKRAKLIAAGVPASALRIATARTRSGVGHAVLVVRTSSGDLVLDNLSSRIREWNRTGLVWIAMSGANPRRWSTI